MRAAGPGDLVSMHKRPWCLSNFWLVKKPLFVGVDPCCAMDTNHTELGSEHTILSHLVVMLYSDRERAYDTTVSCLWKIQSRIFHGIGWSRTYPRTTDLAKVNHTALTQNRDSVRSMQLPSWGRPFVSYPLFVLRNEIMKRLTRVTGERS